jgi:DNA-binding winged helix-turn-helix (wHTH) protein
MCKVYAKENMWNQRVKRRYGVFVRPFLPGTRKTMTRIVIFDKNPASRQALAEILQAEGYGQHCTLVEQAEKSASGQAYLWAGTTGETPPSGFNILKNDIFIKPLRVGTLIDRVRHHLTREKQGKQGETIQIGDYDLDHTENSLSSRTGGTLIRLTEKERHILEYLARHKNQIVDRRALLEEVWGYAEGVETHTLETHIYRLRQKIETDPAAPKILLTEEQGYKLTL